MTRWTWRWLHRRLGRYGFAAGLFALAVLCLPFAEAVPEIAAVFYPAFLGSFAAWILAAATAPRPRLRHHLLAWAPTVLWSGFFAVTLVIALQPRAPDHGAMVVIPLFYIAGAFNLLSAAGSLVLWLRQRRIKAAAAARS